MLVYYFFICSAVRHKQARTAREEQLVEEGLISAEMKSPRKKKKFHPGDQFDHCGGDLGPSQDIPFVNALVVDGGFLFVMPCSSFGSTVFCSDPAESIEDEFGKVFNDSHSLHRFLGFSGVGHRVALPKSTPIAVDEFCSFLA